MPPTTGSTRRQESIWIHVANEESRAIGEPVRRGCSPPRRWPRNGLSTRLEWQDRGISGPRQMRREPVRRQHGLVRGGSGATATTNSPSPYSQAPRTDPHRSRAGGNLAVAQRALSAQVADRFWKGLRETGARIATPTEGDQGRLPCSHIEASEELFFVDRPSIAFMERNTITRAATSWTSSRRQRSWAPGSWGRVNLMSIKLSLALLATASLCPPCPRCPFIVPS